MHIDQRNPIVFRNPRYSLRASEIEALRALTLAVGGRLKAAVKTDLMARPATISAVDALSLEGKGLIERVSLSRSENGFEIFYGICLHTQHLVKGILVAIPAGGAK